MRAPGERLFEHLDDQTRLSAHMSKRSWKMGWSKMDLRLDAQHGQAIGPYRLGFDLMPDGMTTDLQVSIDYDLPKTGLSRFLGRLFGRSYARWCTRKMVEDARAVFDASARN